MNKKSIELCWFSLDVRLYEPEMLKLASLIVVIALFKKCTNFFGNVVCTLFFTQTRSSLSQSINLLPFSTVLWPFLSCSPLPYPQ